MPAPAIGSIEAEQAILGAVLVNNAAADACRPLAAGDFLEPVHGRIWAAMLREIGEGRTADPVLLRHLFDTDPALADLDGGGYLRRLGQAAESIVTARSYAALVRALARKRRLAEAARAIVERAETDPEADAAEILAEALPSLEAEARDDAAPRGKTVVELAWEIGQDLDRHVDLMSTGIAALDDAIGGAPLPGQPRIGAVPYGYIVGFEARPGGLKTGTLATIALHIAGGEPESGVVGPEVCYLACEMGGKRITQRLMAQVGGFKPSVFKYRDEATARCVARATSRLPAQLVAQDCPGLTFSSLRRIVMDHLSRRGCRIFFLDYYQLVQPDGRVDSRQQHLEEVAYWLQATAAKHGITFFVASQQNRDGYTLGGDGLLRACDWIAQINRNEAEHFHPELGGVATLWMDVRKARDGTAEPIGSAESPLLFIHPHGPHLAELPA